jgi:hypothetical protein
MDSDVVLDRGNEFGHIPEDASTYPFAGNLPEPALNEIEPRRTGRREMQHEPRMSLKPGFHIRVTMGPDVVEDQVERNPRELVRADEEGKRVTAQTVTPLRGQSSG